MLKQIKVKYKVVKLIPSPYGVFASPKDVIIFYHCVATNKNISMALPEYKEYTKPLNIFEGLKCIYNYLISR